MRVGHTLKGLILIIGLSSLWGCKGNARARAYMMAIESSLESVLVAQDRFVTEHGRYSQSLDSLGVVPSEEVEIRIITATETGFTASAYNPTRIPGYGCVVYGGVGDPTETERGMRPPGPGQVACDDAKGATVYRD